MAGANVREFTDENFETEVLQSDTPVLVDFWAEWCGPCQRLAPMIDKLADDYQGQVKVGKVDTDANRQIAMQYNVMSIPTVMLFKDGDVQAKIVGLKGEADFRAMIESAVTA